MNPVEKAKHLINSFYQPLGLLHCGVSSNQMWEYGKSSALLVVNELLMCDAIFHGKSNDITYEKIYWQEVKTEINKL